MTVLDPGPPLVIYEVPTGARAAYTIQETSDLLGCSKHHISKGKLR